MDLTTLYFSSAVAAISVAVAMFCVWCVHRAERAVWFWMLGFAAHALSSLLFGIAPELPAWVARLFGNAAAAVALALMYVGTAVFLERLVRWQLLFAMYLPALLLNLYGTLVVDSLALRITAYTICALSACGLSIHGLIAEIAPAQRLVGRFLGAIWMFYLVVCLVRVVGVWDASPNATQATIGAPQMMFFAMLQAVTLLSAIGFLLLLSQRLQLRLADLSSRDNSGGAFTRRAFRSLVRDRRAIAGDAKALVLMILDIDHFQRINDRFGPSGSADVLRSVARLISDQLRRQDIFARAGGEEFWLLSADLPATSALSVAERLRTSVEKHHINVAGEDVRVTISIGVAVLHPDTEGLDLRKAMDRADIALTAAKAQGRNRVVVATEDVADPLESARFAARLAAN